MAPRTRSGSVATTDAALRALRALGLSYPGAHTKSPWPGHLDLAVADRTFAYLSLEGEPLSISCKLPRSCDVALLLPYCKPAGYGLGKSGWVQATPPPGARIDLAMFAAWLDESYRAQAPKKLIAQLDARAAATAATAAARPAAKAPSGASRKAARAARKPTASRR